MYMQQQTLRKLNKNLKLICSFIKNITLTSTNVHIEKENITCNKQTNYWNAKRITGQNRQMIHTKAMNITIKTSNMRIFTPDLKQKSMNIRFTFQKQKGERWQLTIWLAREEGIWNIPLGQMQRGRNTALAQWSNIKIQLIILSIKY